MNIINIGAAAFYIYLFIVLRRMRIQQREHGILRLTVIALFQWTLTAYFVYNNNNLETLRLLLPISCVGMFFFFPLNLHFAYSIVIDRPMPKPLFIILYSIALVLSVVQFFHPISMKVLEGAGGTVVLTAATDSPLSPVWTIYALSCWFISTWLYIRYRREANLNRQQKQANLLIRINCILIILVMGEYYLLPLIPGWKIPSQSPIIFSIWMGGMVYAIWKYGFLRISPQALENKILDSVEDLVLLYSIDGNAVYRNRKALEILGNSAIATAKSLEGRAYESLFVQGGGEEGEKLIKMKAVAPILQDRASWRTDQPEKLIKLRIPAAGTDGSNNIHKLSEKEAQSITVNFRVKPLLDRFEDPLGVLVSGTIVPRFVDMLKTHKFTAREAEVLECLMAGCTIEKTSSLLNITERTVKAHITNIYEKTGAANRIELANMLNGS